MEGYAAFRSGWFDLTVSVWPIRSESIRSGPFSIQIWSQPWLLTRELMKQQLEWHFACLQSFKKPNVRSRLCTEMSWPQCPQTEMPRDRNGSDRNGTDRNGTDRNGTDRKVLFRRGEHYKALPRKQIFAAFTFDFCRRFLLQNNLNKIAQMSNIMDAQKRPALGLSFFMQRTSIVWN